MKEEINKTKKEKKRIIMSKGEIELMLLQMIFSLINYKNGSFCWTTTVNFIY